MGYNCGIRIGIHTSTAGSLENAGIKAAELGANCFQIFSASPRMWRAAPPDPGQVRALKLVRERHGLTPLVIHVSYLVNLASADPVIRPKSVAGFRGELERAEAIGAEFLVVHPGNYKGQSVEAGIAAFAAGMLEAARGLKLRKTTILLENTVGGGAQIGGRLEELRAIKDVAGDLPVAYCLDTCHLLAAGFDVASAAGLKATVAHANAVLGLDEVKVIHANDSKCALGGKLDRHANIGEGHIGREGFRRILTHARLRAKPFILETPVDEDGDDLRNVNALKELSRRVSIS